MTCVTKPANNARPSVEYKWTDNFFQYFSVNL